MIPLPEPVQVSELTMCQELVGTWIDTHSAELWGIGILAIIGFVGCAIMLASIAWRLVDLAERLWQHARRRNASDATTKP
jgi:hypothetical protein